MASRCGAIKRRLWLYLLGMIAILPLSYAFIPKKAAILSKGYLVGELWHSSPNNQDSSEYLKQAQAIREEIKKLETNLPEKKPPQQDASQEEGESAEWSLKGKKVLVVGANGRLGSLVCRNLLRNNPQTKVLAAVHTIGIDSPTMRGYERLSYEIGAEDGIGMLGAAWSENRVATFEFADYMKDFNLQNCRLIDVELLDPVQCGTITEGIDCVVWCATDFNGNKPRAIAGLNFAFFYRALANPTKGRVEIEGLRNILNGFVGNQRDEAWKKQGGGLDAVINRRPTRKPSKAMDFVLVSATPESFNDFETPYGTFHGLKREGENILRKEFPSLNSCILQMGRYEDNFVEENLDIKIQEESDYANDSIPGKKPARINRRDAARAASQALTKSELKGKTIRVWTA